MMRINLLRKKHPTLGRNMVRESLDELLDRVLRLKFKIDNLVIEASLTGDYTKINELRMEYNILKKELLYGGKDESNTERKI